MIDILEAEKWEGSKYPSELLQRTSSDDALIWSFCHQNGGKTNSIGRCHVGGHFFFLLFHFSSGGHFS